MLGASWGLSPELPWALLGEGSQRLWGVFRFCGVRGRLSWVLGICWANLVGKLGRLPWGMLGEALQTRGGRDFGRRHVRVRAAQRDRAGDQHESRGSVGVAGLRGGG